MELDIYSDTTPSSDSNERLVTVDKRELDIYGDIFGSDTGERLITMENKRSRVNVLSLAERVSVIKEHRENSTSSRKLAEKFDCGKTQIAHILANADDILKSWAENKNPGLKRKREEKFPEVNSYVYEWFKCARAQGLTVNGPILKEKALKIARNLGIEKFNASNGWLDRFRQRNNIVFKNNKESTQLNEDMHVDPSTTIESLIEDYPLENIYSVDETGLYFRLTPDEKSSTDKNEDNHESQVARDRITFLFCCNAAGEKEPLLIIGNSQKPQCLKTKDNLKVSAKWEPSERALMTPGIFENWVEGFNRRMKRLDQHVVLFLDNAPCHMIKKLSNVKMFLITPDTTPNLQPLDQGVIQTFKQLYFSRALSFLISKCEDPARAMEFTNAITMNDAVSWAKLAWNEVKISTIARCFISCGICQKHAVEVPKTDNDEEISEELDALVNSSKIDVGIFQFHVPCYDEWTERQELQQDNVNLETNELKEESVATPPDSTINTASLEEGLSALKKLKVLFESIDEKSSTNDAELVDRLSHRLETEIQRRRCTTLKQINIEISPILNFSTELDS